MGDNREGIVPALDPKISMRVILRSRLIVN